MPKIVPFETHAERYEQWFTNHRWVYAAELRAVKALLPLHGRGLEIGIGTGRFATPTGIAIGVEPSNRMGKIAQSRGIQVLSGVAEALPFGDCVFDFALMVTTVCFLDDINKAFLEAYRILAKGGFFIAGIVDRNSPVGQMYVMHQDQNVFYKEATFFSVDEVVAAMSQAGFFDFRFRQTIFRALSEITKGEPVKPGHGQGSFVVIRGRKG